MKKTLFNILKLILIGCISSAVYAQTKKLATPCYVFGSYQGNSTQDALVSFPATSTAGPWVDGLPQTNITHLATFGQIGATWGLGYSSATNKLYAAAYIKRHTGLGPGGTGAIYEIDPNGVNPPTVFVDLNTLYGANTAGVNPHPYSPSDVYPSAKGNTEFACWFNDVDTWDAVGRQGLGDLDVSEDGLFLYVMNMTNKTLYKIPTTATPTTANIETFPFPTALPGATVSCNSTTAVRPMALGIKNGLVYAGAICSGEAAGVDGGSYGGDYLYVYSLNPSTNTWSLVLEGNYGISTTRPYKWRTGYVGGYQDNAKKILSDIDFDSAGGMFLGIRDIGGDKYGSNAGKPIVNDNAMINLVAFGNILKACYNAGLGKYELESNGSCGGITTAGPASGQGLPYTNATATEYFYEDRLNPSHGQTASHPEISLGGVAFDAITGEVWITAYDPISVYQQGVIGMSNTTGARTSSMVIIEDSSPSTQFRKVNGLGDLELINPPVQTGSIGDFIWKDLNNNGIQDASEPGVANVKVLLLDNVGTEITNVLTSSTGAYSFPNLSSGTYKVKIDITTIPAECAISTKANTGTDDAKDSDFDATGLSHLITINTALVVTDTLRNNLNIDGALVCNLTPRNDIIQFKGVAPSSGLSYILTTTLSGGTWAASPSTGLTIDADISPGARNQVMGLQAGNYVFTYTTPTSSCIDVVNLSVTAVPPTCTPSFSFDILTGSTTDQASSNTNTTVASSTTNDVSIFGGERDVLVEPVLPLSGANYVSQFSFVALDNLASWTNGPGDFSKVTITWDGNDNNATTLNATGLGGANLSGAGNFGFLIDLVDVAKLKFTLRVYTDASNYSESVVTFNKPEVHWSNVPIEFTTFTTVAGMGANFTNVGAVQLILESLNLLPESNGIDLDMICFHSPCLIPCTPPTAVTATVNSPINVGTNINLSSSSTGGTSYTWAGPNSFSSTAQNPTITLATTAMTGTYTVTVLSSGTCTATATVSLSVYIPCTALGVLTATATPTSIASGSSSTLNVTGTGITAGVTTFSWAGGSAGSPTSFTSTVQNPSTGVLATAGGYSYTVTVSNANGTGTCTATASTSLTTTPTCVAPTGVSVTITPTIIATGGSINLSSASTGGATNWAWSNGNGFTSTLQNPSTVTAPATAGTYTYTVTASHSANATCTATATGTLSVSVTPTCVAPTGVSVTITPTTIATGGSINLSSASTGATNWAWSNGSGFTSTLQNPSTVTAPATAGTYTYTVTASHSANATCTATATVSLSVSPNCAISATITQSVCNNNGTPTSLPKAKADDYFDVTVSASNGSSTGLYEIVLNSTVVGSGSYGTNVVVSGANGVFKADGTTTYSLTIRDNINNSCTTTKNTTIVANCSTACPPQLCPIVSTQKLP
jgi:PKD repeat protein